MVHRTRCVDQWKKTRRPPNKNLKSYRYLFFNRCRYHILKKKYASSENDARTTGSHMQKSVRKQFQSRSNTLIQSLQLCHCLRNICKKFKVDIKQDDLERSLKSHLITARTEKWIICISKVLQSKRKTQKNEKIFYRRGESLCQLYMCKWIDIQTI